MSRCNFCTLNEMILTYGDRLKLTKEKDNLNKCEWIIAKVDGKFRASFMELSKQCVC